MSRQDAPTGYSERLASEVSRYREVTNVHDLPEIYGYWNAHHVDPLLRSLGFESLGQFFLDPLRTACRSKDHVQVVSLGSGNGDLELSLATELRQAGIANFTIWRLELTDAMRDRARLAAQTAGLSDHFVDLAVDLNAWEAPHRYDVAIANHSLHHVVELEHLFGELQRSLTPDGVLVVNDMIGRNGHMRWPEALDLVQRVWAVMPDRYRFNHQLSRHEPEYENWDCSTEGFEGVRAQDILPLLNQHFHPEVFLAFANVIDLFVDRGFGHNFDVEHADDRSFIDAVARIDESALELGLVKPTHLTAHYRTRAVECRFAGSLSPTFSVRRVDAGAKPSVAAALTRDAPRTPEPIGPPPGPSRGLSRLARRAIALVPPIGRLRTQRDLLAAEVQRLQAEVDSGSPSTIP
ncbi:MAG: class I SAM-dependent methyltransferase [Acidimicrobiales bacterium]